MLETLQTIVIALVNFAIVVAVHEYGHFWVARFNNVKVLRFSIGFGRPLIRWRGADDTEYVIAVLPLGGYVRMADEREDEVEHEHEDEDQGYDDDDDDDADDYVNSEEKQEDEERGSL